MIGENQKGTDPSDTLDSFSDKNKFNRNDP
jgi:hypothetical protein